MNKKNSAMVEAKATKKNNKKVKTAIKEMEPTVEATTPKTKEEINAAILARKEELARWKRAEAEAKKAGRKAPAWKQMQALVASKPELKGNDNAILRESIRCIPDTAVVTILIQYRKYKEEING